MGHNLVTGSRRENVRSSYSDSSKSNSHCLREDSEYAVSAPCNEESNSSMDLNDSPAYCETAACNEVPYVVRRTFIEVPDHDDDSSATALRRSLSMPSMCAPE